MDQKKIEGRAVTAVRDTHHGAAPVELVVRRSGAPLARMLGLAVAGGGASHFTAPSLFEGARSRRRVTYATGVAEMVIGTAIAYRRTRPVGLAGYLAYGAWRLARIRQQP